VVYPYYLLGTKSPVGRASHAPLKGGENKLLMCDFEDFEILSTYTQQQAIDEGILVEIFKNRWHQLSGGKPILCTTHVFHEISLAGLLEIWNEFVHWRTYIQPALKAEDQLFYTGMNGKTIWVIEDADSYTIMFPEDY
jgi:hypothetical protein